MGIMNIVIFGIAFAVGYAVLAGIYAICYRLGRASSYHRLVSAIAGIDAGIARTDAMILNIRSRTRAENADSHAASRE